MQSICPHCNTVYPDTPDEYLGMTCECTNCHNEFVIENIKLCSDCGAANVASANICCQCGKHFPPRLSLASASPQTFAPPYQMGTEYAANHAERKKKKGKAKDGQSNPLWSGLKTVGIIILSALIGLGAFLSSKSSELTESSLAENVKSSAGKDLFQNSQFIYHGAAIKSVTLHKGNTSGLYTNYRGDIVFERYGQTYSRPIAVSVEKDKSQYRFFYAIDFDYSKRPEFMKEDADIFFRRLAEQNADLKQYQFVSAERLSSNVVRCIVRNSSDASRMQVDIRVSQVKDTRNMAAAMRGLPEFQLSWEIIDSKNL